MNLKQKEFLVKEVSKCFERKVSVDWKQIANEVNEFGPPVKDALAWKKSFEHTQNLKLRQNHPRRVVWIENWRLLVKKFALSLGQCAVALKVCLQAP